MENKQDYWNDQFVFSESDIVFIEDSFRLFRNPKSITEIIKTVIKRHLREDTLSSARNPNQIGKFDKVRLWDPAEDWKIEDHVIVVKNIYQNGHWVWEAFVGVVTKFESDDESDIVSIQIGDDISSFRRAEPGSSNAMKWHKIVEDIVMQKMESQEIEDQVTGIMAQYGDVIVSRIMATLNSDDRFICLGLNWTLKELVDTLSIEKIDFLYAYLLHDGGSISNNNLLDIAGLMQSVKAEFELKKTLLKYPERFQNVSSEINPVWKAIEPRPMSINIKNFAYNPVTYEILCSPNEAINQKTLRELISNNLITDIMVF